MRKKIRNLHRSTEQTKQKSVKSPPSSSAMAMDRQLKSAVQLLDDNPLEVFETVSSLLLQICDNILNHPEEIKYRRLRLSNANVSTKLLPATGAIECLFEMGFEEADDSFVLPGSSSLSVVKQFKERLAQKIAQMKPPPSCSYAPSHSSRPTLWPNEYMTLSPFFKKIFMTASSVLEYEDSILLNKARACVPEEELWLAAQNRLHNIQLEKEGVLEAEQKGLPDIFLVELLLWFKHRFFSWVDQPPCQICRSPTSFVGLSADPSHFTQAPRTELFSCLSGHITPFHRYTDAAKLLDTRMGRCGEWATCFTVICRSLGMDARQVFDETDHVWTEVWSSTQDHWLHCDACEAICDAPLTYQAGWGKKLTYCIAYSRDDVQDVTWRYTQESIETVLERRKNCSENDLLKVLVDLRTKLQSSVSQVRKRFLERRLLQELSELLNLPGKQRIVSEIETQGRQSGSKEWREQSPTSQEIEAKCMTVRFSSAKNCYQRGSEIQTLQGWTRGIYMASNIARKEEMDWKKVYLARREGSQEKGIIVWRFEVPPVLEISSVHLQLSSATYSSGEVHWSLVGNKLQNVIHLPADGQFSTEEVLGCTQLTLTAELSGSHGDLAWQHTQLFRQDMNGSSFPLQVTLQLNTRHP
ncbi:hypothetical protein B566_EDAN010477 [Ephemera danica]|nr:hypothetical protein B566_EDAN010477 [Ephemera danica]